MSQVPPGSLGLPILGEALSFLKDPFEFTMSRTRQHGPVWKTRILGDTVVFFAGPKAFSFFMNPAHFTRAGGSPPHLQNLLHADAVPFIDGERHLTRKRLLLAAFTPEALASYQPAIDRVLRRYLDRWAAAGEVALRADLLQLAFDIANILFAAADPNVSDVEHARDFELMNKGAFSPPIKLPFTPYGKAVAARDRLRAYLKDAVATRTGAGSALGVLKAARGPAGEQLTTAELEIELLHFFFAAHAGIAAAIAWTFVTLGEHPPIKAALEAELRGLADDAPRPTTIAVAREILRAYPLAPVTFMGVAKRDLELDGLSIKAGWKAAGAIWPTLQDGATFTDPDVFRADRLSDAKLAEVPEHGYVPQGAGPREGHRCPGESFIQRIMPRFTTILLTEYDFAWPAQDVAPGPGGIGPLPKSGVRVKVTKR